MAKSQYHSAAYHRYFEGFAERKYYDEKENMHIERVYVGSYYRRNISDKRHRVLKIQYAVMYILALAAFVFAGTRNTQINATIYVYIPVILSVLVMLFLIAPIYFNLTAPREMMIRAYRDSSERVISISLFAAVMQVINAVATLAGLCLIPGQVSLTPFLSEGGFLISAVILLWLWQTERHLDYETLPPRNEAPPRASVITLRS